MAQASFTAINAQFINLQTGQLTTAAQYLMQQWQLQLSGGFDPSGNLKSNLLPSVGIVGRGGNFGSILQHIDDNGVVLSGGLTSATDAIQGAVILPLGAVGHTLGSAAMQPTTAFDPNGAAAAAQANAQAYADAAAEAAQSNAEAYASNASNLSSGSVPLARIAGITVSIVTAPLTVGGTTGSMDFTNGVLTAQTQAT